MTHEHPTLPPAGWHPDPTRSGQLRYWDGAAWTERVRPVAPEVGGDTPASGTVTQQSAPEPRRSETSFPPSLPESVAPGRGSIPPASMRPQVVPQRPSREAGFFRSLFDLSFASDRVVTISFARLIYLLVSIFSVLWWIVGAIILFEIGGNNDDLEAFQVLGVLQLVLGPIGVLLTILFCRVALEVTIALIRTSQHTSKLVHLAQTSGGAACSTPEVKV